MKLRLSVTALLLFVGFLANSQEISDTKFGKGLINFVAKDSSFSVKFAPRIQFRANTAWDHDGEQYGVGEQNALIRRARLKFGGFAYSPKLKYKIELGLSNRDISGANEFNRNTPRYILDAVIMWNFHKNFELWAGQTKLPGNIERVVSSANLQLINRSILNSNFNIDRDTGIQLRHYTDWGGNFLTREKIAISQGEGRNVTEGNEGGLQYTARLEFLPFGKFKSKGDYSQSDLKREETSKWLVGFTYDFNHDAVKTRSNLGDYMILADGTLFETNISTFFADTMFKYNGWAFMGEFAYRDAKDPVATDANGNTTGDVVRTGVATNAQLSYLFKSNYEVTGRFSKAHYDDVVGREDQEQYTLGLSRYVVGHKLKIQTDFSYNTSEGVNRGIELRTGFDLHF